MKSSITNAVPTQHIDREVLFTAVNNSRSALIITDYLQPDNPIIYSNKAFLDLTGYKLSEVIGSNCRFLQGPETDKQTVLELRKAVATGRYIRVDIMNYRKDGTPFWNDLIMSPIRNDAGDITHFMGMQVDITERIESEKALQKKTEELTTSNQELEQFTYATSHDLQEPLRMINSYLQLIEKRYGNTLDATALKYLGFATEGAERMQELINDLLLLSKVSTTDTTFRNINMNTVLDGVLRNLRVSIAESGADITVDKLPSMYADPAQMTQLFQNLVSNAIKYRKRTVKPIITITSEKQTKEVIYRVKDNGIGIDKKYFDRIFGVFQRLHTKNEYKGTGVGLAICVKIVDRHGGRLWVESTVKEGSTFNIALPVRGE